MGATLSAKHTRDFDLGKMDNYQFLALAVEAVEKLGWKLQLVGESVLVAHVKTSFSSWGEKISIRIENGKAIISSQCSSGQLFDWGKNRGNVDKFLEKIQEIKASLLPQEVDEMIANLKQTLAASQETTDEGLHSEAKTGKKGFAAIFKPAKGYYVTPSLLVINVLIFVAMVFAGVGIIDPESQNLLDWGANFRPFTVDGQWWRLLTACFLHIGVLHLLFNMYALLYIGSVLEHYLGTTRFLSAYLITGIAASVASVAWHDLTISAGASGAIFGVYGVFIALLATNKISKFDSKTVGTSVLIFVAYNLFYGLQADSGIDNAAHIGGLLSGLVVGFALVPSLKKGKNPTVKFFSIGALGLVLLVSSVFVFKSLPQDVNRYFKEMDRFVMIEERALGAVDFFNTNDLDQFIASLDRSALYWNECLELVNGLEQLNLPDIFVSRNKKLKQYCELRINEYNLMRKSIIEDSDEYIDEIMACRAQIERIIFQLSD